MLTFLFHTVVVQHFYEITTGKKQKRPDIPVTSI